MPLQDTGIAASKKQVLMDEDFEDRFQELWTVAYRVAYRLGGPALDPEGIAAETLVDAFRSWRRIRTPTSWVATVAARRAVRGQRGKYAALAQEAGGAVADGERIDLVRALARLPRRQREVVVLRYIADLTESDVAVHLGIGSSAVKTHARRGLDALRTDVARSLSAAPEPSAPSDVPVGDRNV